MYRQGAPVESIGSRKDAIGRRTRFSIEQGQILMKDDLVDNSRPSTRTESDRAFGARATYVRTKRAIGFHSTLKKSDLTTGWMSPFDAQQGWIPRIDLAVGQKTNKRIEAGRIIGSADLIPSKKLPAGK